MLYVFLNNCSGTGAPRTIGYVNLAVGCGLLVLGWGEGGMLTLLLDVAVCDPEAPSVLDRARAEDREQQNPSAEANLHAHY